MLCLMCHISKTSENRQLFVDLLCAEEMNIKTGVYHMLCKHHGQFVVAHRSLQRSAFEKNQECVVPEMQDIPMADVIVFETAKKGMK